MRHILAKVMTRQCQPLGHILTFKVPQTSNRLRNKQYQYYLSGDSFTVRKFPTNFKHENVQCTNNIVICLANSEH